MRHVLVALRLPAGYAGAMDSTRTQKKRRERLLDARGTVQAVGT